MQLDNIHLVILAGGSGTRLWPLSRKDFPKQFLKVGSDDSLVRETASRLIPPLSFSQLMIVCGQDHCEQVQKEFPELKQKQLIFEPCGKNTAAAIALAAQVLVKKNPKSVMVVLPADHKIPAKDLGSFQECILNACAFAEAQEAFVTLGIPPTEPATGYGYIHPKRVVQEGSHPIHEVNQFREKPDAKTAEHYFKSGEYFWNSGMFVWRAAAYLEAYQKFLPHDAELIDQLKGEPGEEIFRESLSSLYPRLSAISVDYAILENADSVFMIEASFGWDDVGSLDSLLKYYSTDHHENACSGDTVLIDSQENLILSDEGVIACLGMQKVIVIKSREAVLVLPQSRAQEVKLLLEELKKKGFEKYL